MRIEEETVQITVMKGDSLEEELSKTDCIIVLRSFVIYIKKDLDYIKSKNFETFNIYVRGNDKCAELVVMSTDSDSIRIILNSDLSGYYNRVANYVVEDRVVRFNNFYDEIVKLKWYVIAALLDNHELYKIKEKENSKNE